MTFLWRHLLDSLHLNGVLAVHVKQLKHSVLLFKFGHFDFEGDKNGKIAKTL